MRLRLDDHDWGRMPTGVNDSLTEWLDVVAPGRFVLAVDFIDEGVCRVDATLAGSRVGRSHAAEPSYETIPILKDGLHSTIVTRVIYTSAQPPPIVLAYLFAREQAA